MIPGWIIMACKPKYVAMGRCFRLYLKSDADLVRSNFPEYAYEIREFKESEQKKALEWAEANTVESMDSLKEITTDYKIKGTFYLNGISNPVVAMIQLPDNGIDYAKDSVRRVEAEITDLIESNHEGLYSFGKLNVKISEIAAFSVELAWSFLF